jgi:hypothetical protein
MKICHLATLVHPFFRLLQEIEFEDEVKEVATEDDKK